MLRREFRRGLVKGVQALNAPHLKSIRERGRLSKKERKNSRISIFNGWFIGSIH
jgi:hypothetical protein